MKHCKLTHSRVIALLVLVSQSMAWQPAPATEIDPLAGWSSKVETKAVLGDAQCHSMHTYFNVCPESPDGRWVLLFRSTTRDAQEGEVCIVERETGAVRVLATKVTTEDAHRAACQQWSQQGKTVVFHDLRDGEWVIVAVDIDSGKQRVLAKNRQLSWGQPHGETVPLYRPHWNPGKHRDLELLNVSTGAIRTVLTAADVRNQNYSWIQKRFGQRPISIFFPILSSDQRRVMFKLATPAGGDFRSRKASDRHGIVVYDLLDKKFVFNSEYWGHPAWHPSGRQVLNVSKQRIKLYDLNNDRVRGNDLLPNFPGSHPSFDSSGLLFVTDARIAGETAPDIRQLWGVAVGDLNTGRHVFLSRFDGGRGATSWRPSHPHPVFSHDGHRIYYNVNSGPWTQLYVAEQGDAPAK